MTAIEQKMRDLEITPTKLTELTGLSERKLYNYRRGRSRLPADIAVVLAEVFGCQVKDLLETKRAS